MADSKRVTRGSGLLVALVGGVALAACSGSGDSADSGNRSAGEEGMGGEIAFVRREGSRGDLLGDIWVMNADGSEQTNLTESPDTSDADPAWSPDGGRIVFSGRGGGGFGGDIFVINADGSGATNLTRNPELAEFAPAWSPDGKQIAYVGKRKRKVSEIYVMNADGSGQIKLTDSPGADEDAPAWSPNGRRLIFQRLQPREDAGGIYAMNADGSGQQRLTRGSAFDKIVATSPAVSPDGRRIAFLGRRTREQQLPLVWVMNTNGTRPRPLPKTRSTWPPSFLPDGERIALVGIRGIRVVDTDGGNRARLAGSRPTDCCPAWSPVADGSG